MHNIHGTSVYSVAQSIRVHYFKQSDKLSFIQNPKFGIIFLHVFAGERGGVGSRNGSEVDQVLVPDPAKIKNESKVDKIDEL